MPLNKAILALLLLGALWGLAAFQARADVPIAPTLCTGRFCVATYETNFSLQQVRTSSKDGEAEKVLMAFESTLTVAIVLGAKVGSCHAPNETILLTRQGGKYIGNGCFEVPTDNSREYVAVGIAIQTVRPIEDYLKFDGLCIWVKESLAGGIAGARRAQRLGPMRCITGPNNSFKPKPLRGSA